MALLGSLHRNFRDQRRKNAARRAFGESNWTDSRQGRKDKIRNRERIKNSRCACGFENPYLRRIQEHPYCEGGNRQLDFGKSARESVWEFEDCGVENEGEILKCVLRGRLHLMALGILISGKSMVLMWSFRSEGYCVIFELSNETLDLGHHYR
jgi:hypothetical protein